MNNSFQESYFSFLLLELVGAILFLPGQAPCQRSQEETNCVHLGLPLGKLARPKSDPEDRDVTSYSNVACDTKTRNMQVKLSTVRSHRLERSPSCGPEAVRPAQTHGQFLSLTKNDENW